MVTAVGSLLLLINSSEHDALLPTQISEKRAGRQKNVQKVPRNCLLVVDSLHSFVITIKYSKIIEAFVMKLRSRGMSTAWRRLSTW